MVIIEKLDTKAKRFNSLAKGDTFITSLNSDDVYMKTSTVTDNYGCSVCWNAVKLNDGELYYFKDNFSCIPVNINIHVSF